MLIARNLRPLPCHPARLQLQLHLAKHMSSTAGNLSSWRSDIPPIGTYAIRNPSPSHTISQLTSIETGLDSRTPHKSLLLLFTPAFARHLDSGNPFLSDVVNKLLGPLSAKCDPQEFTLDATVAVVDGVTSRLFSRIKYDTPRVVDGREMDFHDSRAPCGSEGLAYLAADAAMLNVQPTLKTSAAGHSLPPCISFSLLENTSHHVLKSVKLLTGNTIFQNGCETTFFQSKWLNRSGVLTPIDRHDLSGVSVDCPFQLTDQATVLLQAHLIPLTVPRKIEKSFGNVIRLLSDPTEEICEFSASRDLERNIPAYISAKQLSPEAIGQLQVYAVVTSQQIQDEERQQGNGIFFEGPKASHSLLEDLLPETWSLSSANFRYETLMNQGATFHRVLGGGGGWGSSAGLITVAPMDMFETVSADSPSALDAFGSDDAHIPFIGRSVVSPGQYVQFFVVPDPAQDLRAHNIDKRPPVSSEITFEARSIPEQIPGTALAEIPCPGFSAGHFGVVSTRAIGYELESPQGSGPAVSCTIGVDIPFSMVTVLNPTRIWDSSAQSVCGPSAADKEVHSGDKQLFASRDSNPNASLDPGSRTSKSITDSFINFETSSNAAESRQKGLDDQTGEGQGTNISYPPDYGLPDTTQYLVASTEPSVQQTRHERIRMPTCQTSVLGLHPSCHVQQRHTHVTTHHALHDVPDVPIGRYETHLPLATTFIRLCKATLSDNYQLLGEARRFMTSSNAPDMMYALGKTTLQASYQLMEETRSNVEPIRRRRRLDNLPQYFKPHVRRTLSTVPEPAVVRPHLVAEWSPDDRTSSTTIDRPLVRTYTHESDRPLVRPYITAGSEVQSLEPIIQGALPLEQRREIKVNSRVRAHRNSATVTGRPLVRKLKALPVVSLNQLRAIRELDPDCKPLIRRIPATVPANLVRKYRKLPEGLSITRSRKTRLFRGVLKNIQESQMIITDSYKLIGDARNYLQHCLRLRMERRRVNVDPAKMTTNIDELMDLMDLTSQSPGSAPDNLPPLDGRGPKPKGLIARKKALRRDTVSFYHGIGFSARSRNISDKRPAGLHPERPGRLSTSSVGDVIEDSLPHYRPGLQGITTRRKEQRAVKILRVPSSVDQMGRVYAGIHRRDTQLKPLHLKEAKRSQPYFFIRRQASRLVRKSVPRLEHRKYEVDVAPARGVRRHAAPLVHRSQSISGRRIDGEGHWEERSAGLVRDDYEAPSEWRLRTFVSQLGPERKSYWGPLAGNRIRHGGAGAEKTLREQLDPNVVAPESLQKSVVRRIETKGREEELDLCLVEADWVELSLQALHRRVDKRVALILRGRAEAESPSSSPQVTIPLAKEPTAQDETAEALFAQETLAAASTLEKAETVPQDTFGLVKESTVQDQPVDALSTLEALAAAGPRKSKMGKTMTQRLHTPPLPVALPRVVPAEMTEEQIRERVFREEYYTWRRRQRYAQNEEDTRRQSRFEKSEDALRLVHDIKSLLKGL